MQQTPDELRYWRRRLLSFVGRAEAVVCLRYGAFLCLPDRESVAGCRMVVGTSPVTNRHARAIVGSRAIATLAHLQRTGASYGG
ncbi:hypothetical protein OKW34_003746 [Paraburkholderia youngii]